MKNSTINKNNFITSNKFAKIADIIFSQNISVENKEGLTDIKIMSGSNNPQHKSIIYKKTKFNIKSDSIIFSHSNYINELFYILKQMKQIKNLTLITTQSDKSVNKKIYSKKPESINNWFSINNLAFESVTSIPLGLGNDFSKKNINNNDLIDLNFESYKKKNPNLYLNFNVNTNPFERSYLMDYFKQFEWASIENNVEKNKYMNSLKESSFVLCPPGNGYDTHRVWETLYSGSIPVVKENEAFDQFKDLPILFVTSFELVTRQLLENFLNNFEISNYNIEKLDIAYWEKKMTQYKKTNKEVEISYKVENLYYSIFYVVEDTYNKYLKKLKAFFYKIFFRLNKFRNTRFLR